MYWSDPEPQVRVRGAGVAFGHRVKTLQFSLGVILLAAGRSRRMGRPKLLLPWGKTSILGYLLTQWKDLAAAQVAVVCAGDDPSIVSEVERLAFPPKNVIYNPAPERGMFSSIQCAARWTRWRPALTHWAIVLGDQPQLRFETLRAAINFSADYPGKVCQPSRAGRPRHPVFLPRQTFAELAHSTARDLKQFLSGHPVALCELDDPGLDLDLDHPEDYQKAIKSSGWSD